MAKDTPSMAKNKIGRSLMAILDPHLSAGDKEELWAHFESSCAYCGRQIDRKSREGHVDHAVSSALGGTNSIYNHVLACARCNGDEKRESDWQAFLKRKASTIEVAEARSQRIQQWIAKAPVSPVDPEIMAAAQRIVQSALDNYDAAVQQMRALRRRGDA